MTTINTWNFNIIAGYNKLTFTDPIMVTKGSFVYLTQTTGRIGIDTNSNPAYSDMVLDNGAYSKLNYFSNWRLYFSPIVSFSSYQANINLLHRYPEIGLYDISITFLSSMAVFKHTVQISRCSFLF